MMKATVMRITTQADIFWGEFCYISESRSNQDTERLQPGSCAVAAVGVPLGSGLGGNKDLCWNVADDLFVNSEVMLL